MASLATNFNLPEPISGPSHFVLGKVANKLSRFKRGVLERNLCQPDWITFSFSVLPLLYIKVPKSFSNLNFIYRNISKCGTFKKKSRNLALKEIHFSTFFKLAPRPRQSNRHTHQHCKLNLQPPKVISKSIVITSPCRLNPPNAEQCTARGFRTLVLLYKQKFDWNNLKGWIISSIATISNHILKVSK